MPRATKSTAAGKQKKAAAKPATSRTKRYTRVYLEMWSLALKLASENGKLSFDFDPKHPKVGMEKIKKVVNKNGEITGTKDWLAVKRIYDEIVRLNKPAITAMKTKGTYSKITFKLPSL